MNSTSESQQKALGIFLVDDSQPIRERIAGMLNSIPGVMIVGEAETPAEAIAGILGCDPDAVVLEIDGVLADPAALGTTMAEMARLGRRLRGETRRGPYR